MKNLIKELFERTAGSKKTTIGGGLVGIAAAALLLKVEEISGCNFSTAFANVDYGQIFVFVLCQVFGAITTDANKTINRKINNNTVLNTPTE